MTLLKIVISTLFLAHSFSYHAFAQAPKNELLCDIWMEAQIANNQWPGAIVGIVKDQGIVWSKAYGYADLKTRTTINNKTLFAIASNTKMFTAIGIMKLRNDGKLDLDDPVYHYVPEILNIQPYDNATADKITIRHLLTHTSGLPVEPWYFDWRKRPMLSDIVGNLKYQILAIPTSTDFKYSNLAYSILGKVIENITQQSYETFMHEKIFTPIGMMNSTFDINTTGKYATGYQKLNAGEQRKAVELLDYNGWSAAGGLYTNLEDLSKYVAWLNRTYHGNDSTLLNSETLREMHRVSFVPKSWSYGIGLGFFIYKNEEIMVGLGGHNPGFKTDITIFPESKIGIITLTNGEDIPELPDDQSSIAAQLIKYLMPNFSSETNGSNKIKSKIDFSPYTGTFSGYWGKYKVENRDGILTIFRITADDPSKYFFELTKISEHTFRVVSKNLSRWRGEIVKFDKAENGKLTQLLMDGTTFTREY